MTALELKKEIADLKSLSQTEARKKEIESLEAQLAALDAIDILQGTQTSNGLTAQKAIMWDSAKILQNGKESGVYTAFPTRVTTELAKLGTFNLFNTLEVGNKEVTFVLNNVKFSKVQLRTAISGDLTATTITVPKKLESTIITEPSSDDFIDNKAAITKVLMKLEKSTYISKKTGLPQTSFNLTIVEWFTQTAWFTL